MKQILIERQGYSERIERMFGKGMVVSLTGQRRVGKSCVMRRIYEKYSQDSHNNVIYIDMEKKLLLVSPTIRTLKRMLQSYSIRPKTTTFLLMKSRKLRILRKPFLVCSQMSRVRLW